MKKKTIIIIYFTLFAVLCFTACVNDLQLTAAMSGAAEAGYGRVLINVTGAMERTVYPSMVFEKYEYNFVKITNEGSNEPEQKDKGEDGYFILEVGQWQVTVSAFAKADDAIPAAAGVSEIFNVSGSEIAAAEVQLDGTVNEGNGTFSYHITYPADAVITVFKLEKLFYDETDPVILTPLSGEPDENNASVLILSGTYAENISAGHYFLTIQLEKNGRGTGANEVIYIYDMLDSSYGTVDDPVAFIEDNFSKIPLTGSVSITGVAVVGETLTANTNALGGSGTIFYQWKRNGNNINGATESTYTLRTTDADCTITVTVIRSDNMGSVESDSTSTVGYLILTGVVTITGIAEVGQTLIANTDNLEGSGTIYYQWKRGGTIIGNNSTYTVQVADFDYIITVTVTRLNNSDSITSDPTAIVTPPPLELIISLVDKLAWLQTYAKNNASYILEVNTNESISPQTLTYSNRSGITIILKGDGEMRTISGGSLFTINSGVNLILDSNMTLQGDNSYRNSLIRVNSGGTLVMNEGAMMMNNNTYNSGGGVYVNGGNFTMTGGEISGNKVFNASGGGVYVNSGTFTMEGGKIIGNTSTKTSSSPFESSNGGGVFVGSGGTFTMTGGEISGNIASSTASESAVYGGGVYVSGTFTITGGEISGNSISYSASENSYFSGGGGVCISGTGVIFTMKGGRISGNTAFSSNSSCGGGVSVNSGTFIMTGGEISGNTASSSYSSRGGGVYVYSDGIFTKNTGGTIYGYTEGDSNSNVVKDSYGIVKNYLGHAVYVNSGSRRETTADPAVDLKSSISGLTGGWEN